MKKMLFFLFITFGLAGCEQTMTRYGFTNMTIDLPCGHKYVHSSWKDSDSSLWYATRPANPGESFVSVIYKQQTPAGIMSGKVTFIETSCKS
jgi:hypothetical protein